MKKYFALLIGIAGIVSCSQNSPNPVLSIEGGQIQGVLTDSSNVMVYKGIPYAAPPVGDFRWKAPQPIVAWDGVKVADTFGPISVQTIKEPDTFYGKEFYWKGMPDQSEDCLYLNVWAPAETVGKTDAGLPVAMWIHGGGYMTGYGYAVTMDGDAWARRGVILVTINYRLGMLGFLSHPQLSAEQGGYSGNYGMMDQIAALKWVYNNIAQFGGDPSNITIVGQSAGAMSVKTLCASPQARPMISKAVIQSGGGCGGLTLGIADSQAENDALGKDIMEANGVTTLDQMRSVNASDFLEYLEKYMMETNSYVIAPHNFPNLLPEPFDQAVADNSVADVPYLIGYNSDDMAGLGGESVARFCEIRDSLSSKPVYEYCFSRNLPGDDEDPDQDSGAFHSAELWYMFGTLKNSWRPFTAADYRLSDEMVDAWTNFCKTGNPGWDAYTKENPYIKTFDVR